MLLRIAFVISWLVMGCFAFAQSTNDWVTFKGTAKAVGEVYQLTPKDKNGLIEVPKDGVSVKGKTVKVKVGAIAKIIKPATGKPTGDLKPLAGCRQRQCVGLLLICCDDGHVISACIGAYGCS